jgi:hypothetical protein
VSPRQAKVPYGRVESIGLCIFDAGTGAVAYDGSTKIQRYYGGYAADNGGCALQCIIRNVKREKLCAKVLTEAISRTKRTSNSRRPCPLSADITSSEGSKPQERAGLRWHSLVVYQRLIEFV